MNRKQYPLHPGQTHVEPMYTQVPTEDYEALKREVQQLREITKGSRTTVDDIAEIKTLTSEVNALREVNAKAQEEIAVLKENQRWRKVSDELPETRTLVLTISNEGCFELLALMEKENGTKFWDAFDDEGHEYKLKEVSYWQALPKAPEVK